MRFLILTFVVVVGSAAAWAAAPAPGMKMKFEKLDDTGKLRFRLNETFPLANQKPLFVPVQLRGYRVPSSKSKDACERKAAERYQAAANRSLANAKSIEPKKTVFGKDRGWIADVWVDGRNFGETLSRQGVVKPLSQRNWCN